MFRFSISALIVVSSVFAAELQFKDKQTEESWRALPEIVRTVIGAHLNDATVQKIKIEQKKNQSGPQYEVEAKNLWGKFKLKYDAGGRLAFDTHSRSTKLLPQRVLDAAKEYDPDVHWAPVARVKKDKDALPLYKLTADLGGDTLRLEIVEDGVIKSARIERAPRIGVGIGFGFGWGGSCEPGYSPFID